VYSPSSFSEPPRIGGTPFEPRRTAFLPTRRRAAVEQLRQTRHPRRTPYQRRMQHCGCNCTVVFLSFEAEGKEQSKEREEEAGKLHTAASSQPSLHPSSVPAGVGSPAPVAALQASVKREESGKAWEKVDLKRSRQPFPAREKARFGQCSRDVSHSGKRWKEGEKERKKERGLESTSTVAASSPLRLLFPPLLPLPHLNHPNYPLSNHVRRTVSPLLTLLRFPRVLPPLCPVADPRLLFRLLPPLYRAFPPCTGRAG
jgi:hypothetical protein